MKPGRSLRRSTLRSMLACLAVMTSGITAVVASPPLQFQPLRLHIEPLVGSTGASISALVEADLRTSGQFAMTADPAGATVVSGTVNGSRLEGRLTDSTGTELLRNIYDGPDLRRGAHELADDVVFALTGRPGIATSRMAFVSDASGRPEIYVCEADGRERRRVTYDGALAAHPSIDRTGSLLTYTSHRGARAEVFALDLVAGARRRLITAGGGNQGACLSPDGRLIALSMADEGWPGIFVMPLDGSIRQRMSPPGWVPSAPAWSPDGNRVVFACDDGTGTGPHLFEGRAGHRARQLTLGVSIAFSPDWSPDGERLVFATRHRGELWLAVWDRGAERVRLLGPGRDPCWGADSRHILFSTGDRLETLHTESGHHRTIIENFGRLSEPTWTK